jgi:hypothetical protein
MGGLAPPIQGNKRSFATLDGRLKAGLGEKKKTSTSRDGPNHHSTIISDMEWCGMSVPTVTAPF